MRRGRGVAARFLIYGLIGWVLEVGFTGTSAAIFERDPSATGKTYLWMHPIYGAGMLGLEWLSFHLGALPWLLRAAFYVAAIYVVEFSAGALLRHTLGRCPWDYGKRGLSVRGLIRLDYAPAWYVAATAFFDRFRLALMAGLRAVSIGEVLVAAVTGVG